MITTLIFLSHMAAADPNPVTKTVTFKNTAGVPIGKAILSSSEKGVKINLDVRNLPAGDHAIHIHETGSCKGPKFDSAGGHFAPKSKIHGFEAPGGHHAGDMRNITVGADGALKADIEDPDVTMDKADTSILKKGGTALVIHEKADDYKSQPAGNAGARIACAEIK